MHNINQMTARDMAFGANQAAELKQAQQMASSLYNLKNATIQKNTTIKNLVATNLMLTKAITNIQLSIAKMCTARVPTSIRRAKQDDIYGAPYIILLCPNN
jgi:hypothetical protein